MPGDRKDPYLALNFILEIGGLTVGGFSEISGLQGEIETEDYREGGQNSFIHKLAGPAKYSSSLVLKHGLTDSDDLWTWFQDAAGGNIERKNVSVILLNSTGDEILRWNFSEAYPVKWTGPDLRAGSADVAVESLELAHHGFEKG